MGAFFAPSSGRIFFPWPFDVPPITKIASGVGRNLPLLTFPGRGGVELRDKDLILGHYLQTRLFSEDPGLTRFYLFSWE